MFNNDTPLGAVFAQVVASLRRADLPWDPFEKERYRIPSTDIDVFAIMTDKCRGRLIICCDVGVIEMKATFDVSDTGSSFRYKLNTPDPVRGASWAIWNGGSLPL